MKKNRRTIATLTIIGVMMAAVTGCSSATAAEEEGTETLRLGYFATVTHTPALVGVEEGILEKDLDDVRLETQVFNAGPAAVEALSAGAIDAAYIGPSPAINTFIKSGGTSARVIAGATSGGAALVVREGIDSPAALRGSTLASPQLGNTQDVALRTWLAGQGLKTSTTGAGDVQITPTENAQTLALFQKGDLDGAWLPEPWASRLVVDAGAHVLVDERELWPGGAFPTTVLLVRAEYVAQHPRAVEGLLRGHLDALAWIDQNPQEVPKAVNEALEAATGKGLDDAVLQRALSTVSFTADPNAAAFRTLVDDGVAAGTQTQGSIEGLFDLTALNRLLVDRGAPEIDDAGLGGR